MKSRKAFKYRLYPNVQQRISLGRTFGCVRFVYNHMLADKIEHYGKTKENLAVTPAQYKDEFPWLREVDSLALANAQLNLQTAYKNFFERPETGFPKFKSKKTRRYSYTTNMVNGNIRFEGNRIRLPKVGEVRIVMHRPIPDGYKVKSVTVEHTPSGRYYASILCEYEWQPVNKPLETFIGLDYSMPELYVDSDGHEPQYPKYYRQAEQRLAREQRKLSHMTKGSNNYVKQRIKVARIHEKVASQRKDFLDKRSHELANAYDCVGVEDLNMQAMGKSLNYGKSVHDNGWGMFTRMLDYKLREKGGRLVKVDRFFPSSQLCHNCEFKNPAVKDLSVREWDCPQCHSHNDRDTNAAQNLRDEAKSLILVK